MLQRHLFLGEEVLHTPDLLVFLMALTSFHHINARAGRIVAAGWGGENNFFW